MTASVTTRAFDVVRSGANGSESVLTPEAVNARHPAVRSSEADQSTEEREKRGRREDDKAITTPL
jgi:parvulin-like peptidyl-prolyl isomerase